MTTPARTKTNPRAAAFRFVRIAAFAFAPTLAMPDIATNKAALIAAGAAALETAFRTVAPSDAAFAARIVKLVGADAPEVADLLKAEAPAQAAQVDAVATVVEKAAAVATTAEATTPQA